MTESTEIQTQTGDLEIPGPRAATEAQAAPPAAPAVPLGDPSSIGLPSFLAGSVALGLALVQFVPPAAAGTAIPIIMTATGFGLLVAALWAARQAQSAVAGVFGVFAGFWLSYAALVLGLTHNWFAIPASAVVRSVELFLIVWLVVIGLLTLGTLRLPLAFTALFVLVEAALALDLAGTANASTALTKAAGWAVFAFVAVGAYLYGSSLSESTGGRAFPLGAPLLR